MEQNQIKNSGNMTTMVPLPENTNYISQSIYPTLNFNQRWPITIQNQYILSQQRVQSMIKSQIRPNYNKKKIIKNCNFGKIGEKPKYNPKIKFIDREMMLRDVINYIINEKEVAPQSGFIKNGQINKKCPISNVPITVPCRGCDCYHSECFDMKQYLLLIGQEEFRCPFCNKVITQEDIRYDPSYFTCGLRQTQQHDIYSDINSFKPEISYINWL